MKRMIVFSPQEEHLQAFPSSRQRAEDSTVSFSSQYHLTRGKALLSHGNIYTINRKRRLRHPLESKHTVGEVLDILA